MTKEIKISFTLLTLALACTVAAWPQETQAAGSTSTPASANSYRHSPEHYFRLNFRVLDISPEGKVMNSRAYSETIATGPKSERPSSIRTGDRVPVMTGSVAFQYIDVGTDIDVQNAEIIEQTVHLYVTASISTLSSEAPANSAHPIVRQTKWNSYVTIPINKPTLIFSADNNADKGKMELELTAVPISH